MKRTYRLAWVAIGLLATSLVAAQYALPTDETGNWKLLLAQQGVVTDLKHVPEGPEGKTCLRLTCVLQGTEEEEFALMHAALPQPLTEDYQAVKVTYKTAFPEGMTGPLLLLHEKAEADYVGEPFLPAARDWRTCVVPLTSFVQTDFAPDKTNGKLDRAEVSEVRLAFHAKLAGGPAPVTLWVAEVEFVKEVPAAEAWPPRDFIVMAEKELGATIGTPNEGPNGEAVTRLDFTLPLGQDKQVFAVTSVSGAAAIAGKKTLRLTYRTQLPRQVTAAMLLLSERGGGTYLVLVPASAEWRTQDVPLSLLIEGPWQEDPNHRFDPELVANFGFGTGGDVKEGDGRGTVWLKDFAFVE